MRQSCKQNLWNNYLVLLYITHIYYTNGTSGNDPGVLFLFVGGILMSKMDTFVCTLCRELQPLREQTVFDHQALCENCLNEKTTFCICCGKRIWVDAQERIASPNMSARYPLGDTLRENPYCPHCFLERQILGKD